MKINNYRIAVIILILALVISQVTLFSKIENLENQNENLQNMLFGVQSSLSQQNYMITTEKADYMLRSISCDQVKINKKTAVMNFTMSVSFDKLPSDAIVSLDYRGTTNHFPTIRMEPIYSSIETVNELTFGSPQTVTLMKTSPNIYTSELNLDLGQNYEFSIVIESKDDSFREIIGVIPALEWSEPNYSVQVDMHELGVTMPDNGRFDFTAKLVTPYFSYEAYDMPYGKILYNFQDHEKNISADLTSVKYIVYYKNEIIDQGEMAYIERFEPEISGWEISDVTKFKADIQSNTVSDLRMDFIILNEDGNSTKSTWWADGMEH